MSQADHREQLKALRAKTITSSYATFTPIGAKNAMAGQGLSPEGPPLDPDIVPPAAVTENMSNDDLQAQAELTADNLAGLSPADYTQALTSLETSNPRLYDAVVIELHKMSDQPTETADEGDGYNLPAALTAPAPSPMTTPEPAAQVELGE